MNNAADPEESRHNTDRGLCSDCMHARILTSDRGSSFLQCQLAFTDPNFAKYPRLPVRYCSGYKQLDSAAEARP